MDEKDEEHASTSQRMNWFDCVVTLENMTKSFNLSNVVDREEKDITDNEESTEIKSTLIPLCISDLL